jgi:radical SAM superfamily enzyme YgiQ (UPF0313 family)
VCDEIVRRGLGEKLRLYAYCSPVPFNRELAVSMKKAGFAGINFGVDSGDNEMLLRLKHHYAAENILNVAECCKDAGLSVMFDLLLGAPGETRESLRATINLMKQAAPTRIGVNIGVRVYPGTELADTIKRPEFAKGVIGSSGRLEPVFYFEPDLAPVMTQVLEELIGDDKRFFFFDPNKPDQNYNYNANLRLIEAVRAGLRGAYWDILGRIE